jgi:hypothetical protein
MWNDKALPVMDWACFSLNWDAADKGHFVPVVNDLFDMIDKKLPLGVEVGASLQPRRRTVAKLPYGVVQLFRRLDRSRGTRR